MYYKARVEIVILEGVAALNHYLKNFHSKI
jgi:hypothetical protein